MFRRSISEGLCLPKTEQIPHSGKLDGSTIVMYCSKRFMLKRQRDFAHPIEDLEVDKGPNLSRHSDNQPPISPPLNCNFCDTVNFTSPQAEPE